MPPATRFDTSLYGRSRSALLGLALAFAACACDDVRIGATCMRNGDCAEGLVCRDGRCMEECRGSRDCTMGAICTFVDGIGTCSLMDDDCERDDECAGELRCALGRCVNACDSARDCGEGDECWSVPELAVSFCVDPSRPPEQGGPVEQDAGMRDGGPGDAGPGDAGPRDAGPRDAGPGDAGSDSGETDGGPPCAGPGCDPVRRIAMGWQHACAVTEGGRIWCWGRDVGGEASGVLPATAECGPARCRQRPVEVARVDDVAAIDVALGDTWSCAARADGTVQCWGSARPAPAPLSTMPALVELAPDGAPLDGVLAMRGGRTHALFDRADGLYGVGTDDRGELRGTGGGVMAERIGDGAAIVGAGAFFSCAVEAGVVSCWGSNRFRELGRDDPAPALGAFSATPAPVEAIGLGTVVELALGGQHACALDDTGAIACWGQARDRTDTYVAPQPVLRSGVRLHDLASASSSDAQVTCARSEASPSRAYCWGRRPNDVFYPEGTLDTTRAVRMWADQLGDVSQVATDGATACVVSAGDVLCWGANSVGQLAQGDTATWSGPVGVRW